MPQHFSIGLIIVDNKSMAHRQVERRCAEDRIDRLAQARGEPKCAAALMLAADADFAAHHVDETLADRESKTRAAVLTAGRIVGLRERLEKCFLDGRRNSDSGIRHLDTQEAIAFGALIDRKMQEDFAAIRKLDRV